VAEDSETTQDSGRSGRGAACRPRVPAKGRI